MYVQSRAQNLIINAALQGICCRACNTRRALAVLSENSHSCTFKLCGAALVHMCKAGLSKTHKLYTFVAVWLTLTRKTYCTN